MRTNFIQSEPSLLAECGVNVCQAASAAEDMNSTGTKKTLLQFCYHCKRRGHTIGHCWRKLGYCLICGADHHLENCRKFDPNYKSKRWWSKSRMRQMNRIQPTLIFNAGPSSSFYNKKFSSANGPRFSNTNSQTDLIGEYSFIEGMGKNNPYSMHDQNSSDVALPMSDLCSISSGSELIYSSTGSSLAMCDELSDDVVSSKSNFSDRDSADVAPVYPGNSSKFRVRQNSECSLKFCRGCYSESVAELKLDHGIVYGDRGTGGNVSSLVHETVDSRSLIMSDDKPLDIYSLTVIDWEDCDKFSLPSIDSTNMIDISQELAECARKCNLNVSQRDFNGSSSDVILGVLSQEPPRGSFND